MKYLLNMLTKYIEQNKDVNTFSAGFFTRYGPFLEDFCEIKSLCIENTWVPRPLEQYWGELFSYTVLTSAVSVITPSMPSYQSPLLLHCSLIHLNRNSRNVMVCVRRDHALSTCTIMSIQYFMKNNQIFVQHTVL